MKSRYENVQIDVKDKTLTLVIDLDEEQVAVEPSKSGKNMVIASTGGARKIDGMSINLTVYRKR